MKLTLSCLTLSMLAFGQSGSSSPSDDVKAAGEHTKKAAASAADATKKAADATVEGTKTAAVATGKATQETTKRAADATVDATHKTVHATKTATSHAATLPRDSVASTQLVGQISAAPGKHTWARFPFGCTRAAGRARATASAALFGGHRNILLTGPGECTNPFLQVRN